MHEVGCLRAGADYLCAAAATARNPEIANARKVADQFDTEVQRAGYSDEWRW